MATIVTRAGKGSPLTNAEVDANFTNLNAELLTKQNTLVSGTSIKTVNGQSVLGSGNIQIDGGVTSFNTRTGAVTLSSGDVTGALGFTPYNSTNPSGYISSINSSMVTTALGFTPYNSTNPSGYITTAGARSALSFVAGSGAYNSTTGAITIPTNTTHLTNGSGYITASASITGNAATATALQTARSINLVSFNGASDIEIARVRSLDDRTLAPADGTTRYVTSFFTSWGNNNTSPYADALLFRSYTDSSGGNDNLLMLRKDALGLRVWQQTYGSATAFSSFKDVAWTDGTNASGTWGISITGSSASTTGNAATATTLQTPRTINGVSFNGSANITVADATKLPLAGGTMTGAIAFAAGQTWPTFNQSTTGNAATATTLQTARTIGGVSFNGTANIDLPGVNTTGNQNTTGNAATATNATNLTGTVTSSIPTSALASGTADSTTYLRGDRTWATISAGGPAGLDTQVQFNNAGIFGGNPGLTFNASTNTLKIGGVSYSNGGTGSSGEIAIGNGALAFASVVSDQVAIGNLALFFCSTGRYNTAIGRRSLYRSTTAENNTAVGYSASELNTTGSKNVSVGRAAGLYNQTGSDNTAVGFQALYYGTGYSNTAVGSGAGGGSFGETSYYENTVVGAFAMPNGGRTLNCAFGFRALDSATTCAANVAIGHRAGANTTTGSNNVLIGRDAGTDAVRNVTTGSNNIVIGNDSSATAHIKISWTVTSDARDKTSFAPVPHGLAFVNALTPTAYQFRVSRDDDTPSGPTRYGFKAQDILELEGANPVIIDNDDPENLKYNQDSMVAVLLNAIKELDAKFESYKADHP